MAKLSSVSTKAVSAVVPRQRKTNVRIGEKSVDSGQTIAQASGIVPATGETDEIVSLFSEHTFHENETAARVKLLAQCALKNWIHAMAMEARDSAKIVIDGEQESALAIIRGRKATAEQWQAIGIVRPTIQNNGEQYGPTMAEMMTDIIADCVSPQSAEYLWPEVRDLYRDDSAKTLIPFSPMVGHSGRTIFVRADLIKPRKIVAAQSAECDLYRKKLLAIPYVCRAGQRIGARHTGEVVMANDGNGMTEIISRELEFVAISGPDRLRDSDSQLFADTVQRKVKSYDENGIAHETTILVPKLKTRTIKRVISRTVEGEGTSKRTRKVQVSLREIEIARALNLESREYRYREILRARLWNWSRAIPDSVKGDYVYQQPKKNGSPETKRLLPIVATIRNGEYRSRRAARIGKKTQAKTSFVGFFLPGTKPAKIVARYDLAEQFPAKRGPREYVSEWPANWETVRADGEPIAATESAWFDSERAQIAIEYLTGRLTVRHTGDARIVARKRAEDIVDGLLAGESVLRCAASNNVPRQSLDSWLRQLADKMTA